MVSTRFARRFPAVPEDRRIGHVESENQDSSRAAAGGEIDRPGAVEAAWIPPVLPDGTIIGAARAAIGH